MRERWRRRDTACVERGREGERELWDGRIFRGRMRGMRKQVWGASIRKVWGKNIKRER